MCKNYFIQSNDFVFINYVQFMYNVYNAVYNNIYNYILLLFTLYLYKYIYNMHIITTQYEVKSVMIALCIEISFVF